MEQNKSFSTPLQRMTVIDALRGFTLLGIILIHMSQHFSIASFSNTGEESQFPVLDGAIQWLAQNVITGRFNSIFAFLFGLSFFIQMDRAAKKGINFRMPFLRRMVVLFIIGLAANCLYMGDVLSTYAILGTMLVFLFRVKSWILMIVVSLLLLGAPRIMNTGYEYLIETEQTENVQNRRNESPVLQPSVNMEKPSFISSVKNNFTRELELKMYIQFGLIPGRSFMTLALFIIGFIAGRMRFFEDVYTQNRRNVMLFAGFVLAALIMYRMIDLFPLPLKRGYFLILMALNDIGSVAFSGALVMGFILLYQVKGIGRCLKIMAPLGRMGLTSYEMQGLIGCFLFSAWAFGSTVGSWGTTEVFVLGLAVYTIQIIISKYWLKYFLYGPLEWLWRSATYLKWQPFVRK
ncbi:MAG: DUF418 domain-containing protein [Dysgonamonadaceae bacterium]|jgi:uncharacterized protein|nr:DUF418 domain-containing protein [Dysgonamonadaceae bacterium]